MGKSEATRWKEEGDSGAEGSANRRKQKSWAWPTPVLSVQPGMGGGWQGSILCIYRDLLAKLGAIAIRNFVEWRPPKLNNELFSFTSKILTFLMAVIIVPECLYLGGARHSRYNRYENSVMRWRAGPVWASVSESCRVHSTFTLS
jgi:hypothetical protein